MAEHTPGPWETHQQAEGYNSLRVCKPTEDGECRSIADAEILRMPREEAEANARLIAAAPALLEALEAVAKLLDQGQPVDPEHDGAWIRGAIAQAREEVTA